MSSSLRLSSFPFMVTQRLRHSWMLWRRSRVEKRLARAVHRLERLQEMGATQLLEIRALERRLHPLQVVQVEAPREVEPPPPPEQRPSPPPVMAPVPVTPEPETAQVEPGPELDQTLPEPEEDPEPPAQQIAQLLGLPTQRSTSPPWRR